MELVTTKAALSKELSILQGVVEKKTTVPMLSNVLIETKSESKLALIATDLEVSLETECSADVSKPGSVVLQARKFFDIVRALPDAEMSISKDDKDWVHISCGQSRFRMAGLAKEHFPSTPRPSGPGEAIPATLLNNLINRTIYAITLEESRYALSGARFVLSGNTVQMVATDGHRLAFALSNVDGNFREIGVIVPRKALNELLRLTAGEEQPVEFSSDENHLFFRLGYRLFSSRVLSGQFPDFDRVIPKNNDKSVEIGVESFGQVVRRVALMADDRSHGIKMELHDSQLVVSSQTPDLGEARDMVPVEYSGADTGVGFNAQYILEFLNVVGTEKIIIELRDEQSPALFRPAGSSQFDYRYVVMPMRLL